MSEASLEITTCPTRKWDSQPPKAGGEQVSSAGLETRGGRVSRQHAGVSTLSACQNPHGVESGPNAEEGETVGTWELARDFLRDGRGDRRSLRAGAQPS